MRPAPECETFDDPPVFCADGVLPSPDEASPAEVARAIEMVEVAIDGPVAVAEPTPPDVKARMTFVVAAAGGGLERAWVPATYCT